MERDYPNARLPEDMEAEPAIEDFDSLVEIGQGGWMSPGFVRVATDRRLWLYTHLALEPQPNPLNTMYVYRKPEGYVVDISNCAEVKWKTSVLSSEVYSEVYGDQSDCVPVIQVIRKTILA